MVIRVVFQFSVFISHESNLVLVLKEAKADRTISTFKSLSKEKNIYTYSLKFNSHKYVMKVSLTFCLWKTLLVYHSLKQPVSAPLCFFTNYRQRDLATRICPLSLSLLSSTHYLLRKPTWYLTSY